MTSATDKTTAWVYGGIWQVLVDWFRVPQEPPSLPVKAGQHLESFRPAEGFLRYLKLWFWILCLLIDLAILVLWIIIVIASPLAGVLTAIPLLLIAVVPDVISFVAIHLRYDTTWYVMTDRSLRIRRGIWTIHETTITFENVQNVKVHSGPVQRYFGISNLEVETAGAGGETTKKGMPIANKGIIEGVSNAEELRQMILNRLRQSQSAGLGDEESPGSADGTRGGAGGLTPAHIAALREIRDEAASLRGLAGA